MKKAKTLRPEVVRILGRDYAINFTEDLGRNLGTCDVEQCEIEIRDGQHPVEEADTVLHEIMHGLMFTMNIGLSPKQEESVVRKMATGLIAVFQDNPDLLTYFANVDNPRKRQ